MQKKFAISEMALITGLRCRTTIRADAIAQTAIMRKKTESKFTGRLGLSTIAQENWYKDSTKF
jgi:hypothetical protein